MCDGEQHVVDAATVVAWSRHRQFACALCGHDFVEGDVLRFIMTNTPQCCQLGVPGGNPFVCLECDGTNDEVYAKLIAGETAWQEIKKKYWWFLQDVIAEGNAAGYNEAARDYRRGG